MAGCMRSNPEMSGSWMIRLRSMTLEVRMVIVAKTDLEKIPKRGGLG